MRKLHTSWQGKLVGALALLGIGPNVGVGAEVYLQPKFEVSTEVDTNRNFDTVNAHWSEGYLVSLGGTLGIDTPRSDTIVKPWVTYDDFPKAGEHSIQGIVDFLTNYRSPRSVFTLFGRFDHRDTYSSELASADFNSLNPNVLLTPETGLVTVGGTRELLTLGPSYTYDLTPRWQLGADGTYQSASYGGGARGLYIPYDYSTGRILVGYALTSRTKFDIGVRADRYDATDGSGITNGGGVAAGLGFNWSPVFKGSLELVAERYDIKSVRPTPVAETRDSYGMTYTTTWTGQISSVIASAGRTLTPSGSGGIFNADQIQIEYNRKLTERFSFLTADRFIRYSSTSGQTHVADYDYIDATADLKWLATRTFYLAGGLEFFRENYRSTGIAANNTGIHVTFGYEALGRRP
jgi:hypothetical protein